ncbi:MAG: response regulator, partial [bacterium]|nr:response regulator [bacterium]
MMKGRISLESQPGQGSTFKILLENVEVSSPGEVSVEEESFDLENISFEPARILVVDDIESNRTVLQEMLPRVQLEVVTAENGEEALFIAGEYLPHIIIMDIAMPVMDGLEATEALKSNPKTKDIPVIILSASSTAEQKEKILRDDMFTAYLTKPLNVSLLLKELSNHLPHSRTAESASGPAHDKSSLTIDVNELPEETLTRLPDLVKVL